MGWRGLALVVAVAVVQLVPAVTVASAANTLAYAGGGGVVTITATSATYIEIDARSGPTYRVRSNEGFSSVSPSCALVGGAHQCTPAPSGTIVNGSPQVDTIIGLTYVDLGGSTYNPPIQANLGAGNDVFQGGDGLDTVVLGDGDDSAQDYLGGMNVTGGPGTDKLIGGRGADRLDGEGGEDQLDGSTGADQLLGGDGVDVADYQTRASGVDLSLDGQANDGEPGEGDAIASDVERLTGGAGADRLLGDGQPNQLFGGAGADTLDAGPGALDVVDAGDGDDVIGARDAAADQIRCGAGTDSVTGDSVDAVEACERLDLLAPAGPSPGPAGAGGPAGDVDRDGVLAPLDCADDDPGRRPGLVDVPSNGRDEDCSGADALLRVAARIQLVFSVRRGRTQVRSLVVRGVPSRGVVELRCLGGRRRGCFASSRIVRFPRGRARAVLSGELRRVRLRAGAVLEVRVRAAGRIGLVRRYTARSGRRAPLAATRCLPPGASSAVRC